MELKMWWSGWTLMIFPKMTGTLFLISLRFFLLLLWFIENRETDFDFSSEMKTFRRIFQVMLSHLSPDRKFHFIQRWLKLFLSEGTTTLLMHWKSLLLWKERRRHHWVLKQKEKRNSRMESQRKQVLHFFHSFGFIEEESEMTTEKNLQSEVKEELDDTEPVEGIEGDKLIKPRKAKFKSSPPSKTGKKTKSTKTTEKQNSKPKRPTKKRKTTKWIQIIDWDPIGFQIQKKEWSQRL